MPKLNIVTDGDVPTAKIVGYSFKCPGCGWRHVFWTDSPHYPKWAFNGNLDKPSFTPSLLDRWHDERGDMRCHIVLTDGIINFCGDCSHPLAGQSIPMIDA